MDTIAQFLAQLFGVNKQAQPPVSNDIIAPGPPVRNPGPSTSIDTAPASVSFLGFVPTYGSHAPNPPSYTVGTDAAWVENQIGAQQRQAANIRAAGGVVDPQEQWQHNVMPWINAVNQARADNAPVPGSYRTPDDVNAEAVSNWNSGAGAYIAAQNAARGLAPTMHAPMHPTDLNEGGL